MYFVNRATIGGLSFPVPQIAETNEAHLSAYVLALLRYCSAAFVAWRLEY